MSSLLHHMTSHDIIPVLPPGIPEVEQALKEAVHEMGSTDAEDFDLQFNVDILSPGTRHADTEVCQIDASSVHGKFLYFVVIKTVVLMDEEQIRNNVLYYSISS